MSVKVSLKENAASVKGYPKLMVASDGLIVLFIEEKCGTVIQDQSKNWQFAEFSERFKMLHFKDYDGEVTLKNE